MFHQIRGVLFDMDGVIYHGTQRLDGVLEFLNWLEYPYLFVTNNSTRTPETVVERLAKMNIAAKSEQILTSSLAAALYLRRITQPGTHVYIIGETGLHTALTEIGFVITDDSPEYVVVGLDHEFNDEKLKTAAAAIQNGATLIATNTDRAIVTEKGVQPGTGTIVAKVEEVAGQKAAMVMGKPERRIFEMAAQRLGLEAHQLMMIGDNLETDIQGGQAAGLMTVLVLTGITSLADAQQSTIEPDFVMADLSELMTLWQSV